MQGSCQPTGGRIPLEGTAVADGKPDDLEEGLRAILKNARNQVESDKRLTEAVKPLADAASQAARAAHGATWAVRRPKQEEITLRQDIASAIDQSERSAEKPTVPNGLPPPNFWTFADKAMLGLCELLALLFGLPFGEDLYNDKPVTRWHLFYLAIGVLFAVAGPMWPWIRTRTWLPAGAIASLSKAPLDARLWIAALLLLFIYATGPELYKRAVSPAALPVATHEPPTSEDTIKTKTQIQDQLNAITQERDQLKQQLTDALTNQHSGAFTLAQPGAVGTITWRPQPQLLVLGGGPDAQIAGILFQGISSALVQMKEAYVVSNLTGHKEPLKANIPYKGAFPVDQIDIPSGAAVDLILEWKPPLSLRDFMDRWGDLQVTVLYDQFKFQPTYDHNYIRGLIQNTIPEALGPRMTPKGQ
jgi:hypothetical protein